MAGPDDDDMGIGGDDAPAAAPKKASGGLSALLPNLLKFVAIGLGALIFIVTVTVITVNIVNKGGSSQTVIPSASPFTGARQQYQAFTAIGVVRTSTKDTIPYSVVVDMVIGYDENDNTTATELTGRLYELRDFVRQFFKTKTAIELAPENEARLKQEILEQLNTKILNSGKTRIILFTQLDVMATS
jgi:flagellar FliL protein